MRLPGWQPSPSQISSRLIFCERATASMAVPARRRDDSFYLLPRVRRSLGEGGLWERVSIIQCRLQFNRSRRVAMCGDDLVGVAAGDFGHAVELPGEAAGAGGRRTQLDDEVADLRFRHGGAD